MFVIAAAQTAQWIFNVQQIFALSINWLPAVSLPIFLIVVVWTLWDLSQKIEKAENKKPSISVVATSSQDLWCLEVTNDGAEATFSAVVIIVPGQPNSIGERWNALWVETMMGETKLMNGRTDVIKIASIKCTDSVEYFVMHAYSTVKKAPGLARRIEYKQFIGKAPMTIQVIISSSPALRDEKPFVKTYSISSHHIMESKYQLKRLGSFPGELIFDDYEPAY